jgi:hypothetical protein
MYRTAFDAMGRPRKWGSDAERMRAKRAEKRRVGLVSESPAAPPKAGSPVSSGAESGPAQLVPGTPGLTAGGLPASVHRRFDELAAEPCPRAAFHRPGEWCLACGVTIDPHELVKPSRPGGLITLDEWVAAQRGPNGKREYWPG